MFRRRGLGRAVCCRAGAIALATATVLTLAVPPSPAGAGGQPALVVWAGPLVPGTELRGVRLNANGSGTSLLVKPGDRGGGKITTVGSFTPSGAQLAAIRSAAKAAFATPGVMAADAPSRGSHGSYAAAVIRVGSATRTVLGVNRASSRLGDLLAELNQALPPSRRLDNPETGLAETAQGPSTSACPPGQSPTTISRRMSLDEAASHGIVTLTAKGGYAGDAVAVDATWKPTNAPVTVQINLEVSTYPGGPTAASVEAAIESRLPARTAIDGTEVRFDVVARPRAPGAAPSPCFHQARMLADPNYRGHAGEADQNPLTTPMSGEWPSGRGAVRDRQIWTHEALHLAGLSDRYSSFFKSGNKLTPIPDDIDIADKQALEQWAKSQGLATKSGRAGTKAKPGHEQDIMGDVFKGTERLLQIDVDTFAIVGADELTITGKPGDLLLNKLATEQNLAVGAPFEVTVRPGKDAHVDGMVAYCIDLRRSSPDEGQRLDVLGSAGAQPQPALQALQRVLDVSARLQPAALRATPGAQDAVWRVTDDASLDTGAAIFALAGLSDDVTYAAPHFDNPNAAGPTTGAVTQTGVVPAPPPRPYVAGLRVRPRRVRAGRPRTIRARVTVAERSDRVRFELHRRQRLRWRRVRALATRTLRPGTRTVRVRLGRLRRGSYRVVARGRLTAATAPLRVR